MARRTQRYVKSPRNGLYAHRAQADRISLKRLGSNLLLPRSAVSFRSSLLRSGGGMNLWRLALPERERFGLVYAREPVRQRRGDTIRTTRALPPLPLQHLG
jgi:hypothetical protein